MNSSDQDGAANRVFWIILSGLVVLGLALRLWGIDLRGITHPEVYVPGIALIDGISEPPPRLDFGFALWWHFHDEPHPIGWYLAMMGWTEIFGTSHIALRMPSALAGAASVLLIALVARQVFGRNVALIAAAMMALHGFHLFWSQAARMYSTGMALGLLATLILIHLARSNTRRPLLELAYVATCFAGIQTVELFWPLLLLQVGWVALLARDLNWGGWRNLLTLGAGGAPRLLQVQAITLMLAAPGLLHSLYRSRAGAAQDPNPDFLVEYAGFGFLFATDEFAIPTLEIAALLSAGLAFVCLVLVCIGLARETSAQPLLASGSQPTSRLVSWFIAISVSVAMYWMASIALIRSDPLKVTALLPLMALGVPAIAGGARGVFRTLFPWAERGLQTMEPAKVLFVLYALVAPLVLFAASYVASILAPRAFLIFVPYLLIMASAGLWGLARFRILTAGVGFALVAAFAMSVPYAAQKPGSPRDYQAIAQAVQAELEPDDLVFLRDKNWADTPLFYYWRDANFIVEDWAGATAKHPDARVWVITWPGGPDERGPAPDRRAALADGYELVKILSEFRAEAELYQRAE